jgi:uncharacterized membrane protein
MSTAAPPERSSTGLEINLASTLTYLLGFVTGIVFLLIEKDSRHVRFHAMQSTLVFLGLFGLNLFAGFVPLLGWIVAALVFPVSAILWLILMFKAYQGEKFMLPVIGDIAERNA